AHRRRPGSTKPDQRNRRLIHLVRAQIHGAGLDKRRALSSCPRRLTAPGSIVLAQAPNGAGLYRLGPCALRRRTLLVCAQAPYGAGLCWFVPRRLTAPGWEAPHGAWPLVAANVGTRGYRSPAR